MFMCCIRWSSLVQVIRVLGEEEVHIDSNHCNTSVPIMNVMYSWGGSVMKLLIKYLNYNISD